MAITDCLKIQHHSDPKINYTDSSTGVPRREPDTADNARTLNKTAPTVSRFRVPHELTVMKAGGGMGKGVSKPSKVSKLKYKPRRPKTEKG